ncbi:MAG: hypothetical protein AAFW83_00540 [Pseudomonadota bacterium]
MAALRFLVAFALASLTTFLSASIFQTHQVLGALRQIGVEISLRQHLAMVIDDIIGFTSRSDIGLSFPVVIAAALFGGFLIAEILKRLIRPLAPVAYVIAGAAAMAVLMAAMYTMFQASPIAGARGTTGLALQMLAGGLGGWVFTLLQSAPKRSRT